MTISIVKYESHDLFNFFKYISTEYISIILNLDLLFYQSSDVRYILHEYLFKEVYKDIKTYILPMTSRVNERKAGIETG